MKLRFTLLLILATFTLHINAQKRTKFNEPNLVKAYTDSLSLLRTRIDTMTIDSSDIRSSVLFEPMTFYSEPIRQMLRLGGDKDYTTGSARTIYSCCRCILQDRNLLDALGGNGLKTSLYSVNKDKRGVTSHQRCDTTEHDG